MPARKDFFHLHGADEVKGIPNFNWREFLRYNGSRARRRDRVFKSKQNVDKVYSEIQREMLACLRLAGLLQQEYVEAGSNGGINASVREAIVKKLHQRAKVAVDRIFKEANA